MTPTVLVLMGGPDAERDVSVATIRSQLKRLRAKTGSANQTELVRRLLVGAGMIPSEEE